MQPNLRGTGWRLTIEEQRDRLATHLSDNPSLTPKLPGALSDAYRLALLAAQRETGLDRPAFPAANPWTIAQIMDGGFYP